ncbi:TonB-dependent receptor plug domain-containing protein [Methylomarinum vadi]|uniref:TonB-dependent receptor plug domain-containing protein n=1 Tax=Methylomarinum vadi TaxID=438855 RepID=UPI0004DEFEAA|nr:TonB-dependent receptor [Methylomarinum vadi]
MLPLPAFSSALEEELSWVQAESIVFSASRREQRVSDTAAAVYVLGNEEIKRSGATSVPEALRLVPGLQVARLNSNTWAISSRGFNRTDSNKLLVMIDGRTVYHPVFSGTLWRTKDVMLEDVDRIEVIRGPGATMWGSNAVNGVINVITKQAKDTQGLLVTAGGGSEERGFGSMRYGGKIDEHIDYRTYVKYIQRDKFRSVSGKDTNDEWENVQGGFRVDARLTEQDAVTLQGDIYHGKAGSFRSIVSPTLTAPVMANIGEDYSGGNVLGKWTHTLSPTAGFRLQMYYDRTENKTSFSAIDDAINTLVDTYDLDFQNHFELSSWQHVNWGIGWRYVRAEDHNAVNFSFTPPNREFVLYNGFIQDELTLLPDRLKFIIGSKFEHNDFSGFEFQPNARLIVTPDNKQTLWASVSRAVRIPNRIDHDLEAIYLGQTGPAYIVGRGNSNFDSEQLIAYEIGYRLQPNDNVSFDIAAFYNDYDKLTSTEVGAAYLSTTPTPHLVVPFYPGNNVSGETYGVELVAQWQALEWWRLQGTYSFLQMQLHTRDISTDPNPDAAEGDSPHHQFVLRSSMDLPENLKLDTTVRYVDNLPNQNIPGYTELDLRLAWEPSKNFEFSVVGQNLLDSHHPEFGNAAVAGAAEVQRGVYGKIAFSY